MSWPMVRFGDVAQIVTGSTPKAFDENFNGDIPFVTPGDLGEVADIHQAKRSLSALGAASVRTVPKRSVMVCCIGATIGKVGFATRDVATNQQINTLVFDEKIIFPKYAYYYCLTIKSLLVSKSSSTTMPIVNKSNFSDLKMPVPFLGLPSKSLAEQKRIAAILDKADAIRRKRQQAIQLADDFLRSVFLDMFGDPVTNPKGWEIRSINQVCTEIVDCVNRTAPTVDYTTSYKMIRTTNVRNYALDTETVRFVEEDTYLKWVRRLIPQVGDLIFTREAPAGEAAVINTNEKIFLGQRTMHFRPDPKLISSEYLLFELMGSGVKMQIDKMHAGSTVTHLSVPECKKFNIRIPPFELQKKFELVRLSVLHLAGLNTAAGRIPLFESLSQKAFSGEL